MLQKPRKAVGTEVKWSRGFNSSKFVLVENSLFTLLKLCKNIQNVIAINKIKHGGHSVVSRRHLSGTLTIAVPLLKHIFLQKC